MVKVEDADGDPLRRWGPSASDGLDGALFEFLNTSKRGARGTIADAHVVDRCVVADVVVHSSPPGTFPVAPLLERNPSLVIASISPFGQDGPWADRPATEFTLQAHCGSIGSRGLPEQPPLAAGGRLGEYLTGAYAAVAIAAAIRRVQRTGHGEHLDVAMLPVMSLTMNTYAMVFAEMLGWPEVKRPTRAVEVPSIEPTTDGYACFTTNSAQQLADFLVLIERPDQLEAEDSKDWFSHAGRFARRDEFNAMTRAFTGVRSTAEVLDAAELLRIPSGPVGRRFHRHYVRPVPGPRRVRRVAVGSLRPAACPVPDLGRHAARPSRARPHATPTTHPTGRNASRATAPDHPRSRSTEYASSTSPRGGPVPQPATSSRSSAPT